MKAKYWLIVVVAQMAGTVVGMGATHVDRLEWAISLILLLPGALVALPFFTEGHIGNNWPQWTVFGIAVGANLVLSVFADRVLAWRRSRQL